MNKNILALVCLLFCFGIQMYAQTIEVDGVKYTLNSRGTAKVARQDYLVGDVVIPEMVYYDGKRYVVNDLAEYAFASTAITSILLPNTIYEISSYAFSNCNSLRSITLPNELGEICYSAFEDCKALSSISIPASVSTIGQSVFVDCPSLKTVNVYWENPKGIRIGSSPFPAFLRIHSQAVLYVPYGTKELYKAHSQLNYYFKNIVEREETDSSDNDDTTPTPNPSDIDSNMEKCKKPSIYYSNKQIRLYSTTPNAQYHYTIKAIDDAEDVVASSRYVNIEAGYNITAWATADGYAPSDEAKATIYFIDGRVESSTGIDYITEQRGIIVSTTSNLITINELSIGDKVELYTTSGTLLYSKVATSSIVMIPHIATNEVVILKVGNNSMKVLH